MLPTLARAPAFTETAGWTIGPGTTTRADAAILFETRTLTGRAFLLRLRWSAVAFAATIATLPRSILREQREGCTAHHQSRDDQSGECFVFHSCSFC